MKMFIPYLLFCGLVMCMSACRTVPVSHWFPVTPKDIYEKELYKRGAEKTQAGQTWFNSSRTTLTDSLHTTVPYQERFYLSDLTPAQSIRIKNPEGRTLVIKPDIEGSDSSSNLFMELYQLEGSKKPRRIEFLENGAEQLFYTHHGTDTLLLRLQTGINERLVVTLTISSSPSLGFPVAGRGISDVISIWGAKRDGGIRLHEGIDISAKRKTPVVASANGMITLAGTNTLGGKVIFQSVSNSPYNLYYAHLDSQFVSAGTRVKLGDTLGLVGNTGNAITTSPHLHFGIYANGAVNPLPFIDNKKEKIAALPKRSPLHWDSVKVVKATHLFASTSFEKKSIINYLPANVTVQVLGETARGFRIRLTDGTIGYIPAQQLKRYTPVKISFKQSASP